MSDSNGFTAEQQNYLQGFALGADVARKVQGLPVIAGNAGQGTSVTIGESTGSAGVSRPESMHFEAQDRQVAAGGKLCAEESAKREKNALDTWDEMRARAAAGDFPKGTDVLLTKFHGIFYVAPAQDAYMCRMRFAGGALSAWQFKGIADLADLYAGGYVDVTTRANLQLREIGPSDPVNVLMGLRDLGVVILGSGGDNVRNVTASPLSGYDPTELHETLPLARDMHHTIMNHREFYGLPRKFNIAFDGGGRISALEDTNDIGFTAVEVSAEHAADDLQAGVYYQLTLGGITGHNDFARYAGVLLQPNECVDVASSILRVFIASGDRTDRKKARLKYMLDQWGFEKFLTSVEEDLGKPLRRVPLEQLNPRASDDRQAHVGIHPQKQPGLNYVGVVLPVGRMTSDQVRGLADLAQEYGNGDIRLTVWQNLLLPNVADEDVGTVTQAIETLGLDWRASSMRAGLVACTGNAGCKFAAADTKRHAMMIAQYVEDRVELDQPVNIHVTGCHHSCAQHYIGDIGLLGANVEDGDDMVEGYQLFVGGGYGERQRLGRELYPPLRAEDLPPLITALLVAYLELRTDSNETFVEFTSRHSVEQIQEFASHVAVVP